MMKSTKAPEQMCVRELIRYLGEHGKTFSASTSVEMIPAVELDSPLAECIPIELARVLESQLYDEFLMDIMGESTLRCEPLENGDLRVHCNENVRWMLDYSTCTYEIGAELVRRAEEVFLIGEADNLGNLIMWPPEVIANIQTGPNGALRCDWEEFVTYDSQGEEYPLNHAQARQLKQFIEQTIFQKVPGELRLEECDFEIEFGVGVPALRPGTCRQAFDTVIPSSSLNDDKRYPVNLSLLSEL